MTALVARLAARIGLPKPVQDVLVHVTLVFLTAFAGQIAFPVLIRAVGAGTLNWSALAALATSAAVAGTTAATHYLAGLVPGSPPATPVPPTPKAT